MNFLIKYRASSVIELTEATGDETDKFHPLPGDRDSRNTEFACRRAVCRCIWRAQINVLALNRSLDAALAPRVL